MIEIKQISKEDINKIVYIHNIAFKDFFLTSLGNNFLKIYYESVRQNEIGILLGVYEDDILCGFCAATTNSKGFNYHLVRRNYFRYGLVGLRLLFTHTRSLYRLIKNFKKNNPNFKDDGQYAELLSIGISKIYQNKGIGKMLLLHLEDLLKEKKIKKISLTTDSYNNEKAIQFYKGLGYDKYYEFSTYPNRTMYRLIKIIT